MKISIHIEDGPIVDANIPAIGELDLDQKRAVAKHIAASLEGNIIGNEVDFLNSALDD